MIRSIIKKKKEIINKNYDLPISLMSSKRNNLKSLKPKLLILKIGNNIENKIIIDSNS
jgi:hypothetical protein